MTNEKNSNSEPKEQQPKFNREQYARLMECSKKGPQGIEKWNKWRVNKIILLEGSELSTLHLQGVDLERAKLQGANFLSSELQGAKLWNADLKNAKLYKTHLEGAKLLECELQGAEICNAYLQGADFSRAIVDGQTLIWNCEIDEKTKFEGVGLGNIRIYPKEKQLLEYNIRRMNWGDWYKYKDWDELRPSKRRYRKRRSPFILFFMFFIRCFWEISDYGKSTGRIIVTFFVLAFDFAVIYWLWPNFVAFNGNIDNFQSLWHAFYFSVVTMTTLGFGDIAASPDSWIGQTLLMLQVILGYMLLGALVTRFAVLFLAGGPVGKSTSMDEETKQFLAKLKEDKDN